MGAVITLTTDFGTGDGYVGAMKGVILSLCPDATVIDITHEIPPQDVQTGAYVLSNAAPHFPPSSIHLAVVDPGVGTSRRGMILFSGGNIFVGPDNGLFSFALESMTRAIEIIPDAAASATFHGRDLFAPAAAKLAGGMNPSFLGPELANPVRLPAWEKTVFDDRIEGYVIHIDRFGDVISNLRPHDFPAPPAKLEIPGSSVPPDLPLLKTYGESKSGQALWLVSSDGCYELAIRDGNAAKTFGIKRGDKVIGYKKTA